MVFQQALALLGRHFELLLLLYWGLATFASTVALLPVPWTSRFRAAVQLSACRGKLMDLRPATRALGPLSDWTVPQAWFSHFYALGATWNAAVAWMLFAPGSAPLPEGQRASVALVLALLQVHLCRRWAETVGPLTYPPGARMHGIAYVFGMSYYFLVSLSVLPPATYPALTAQAAQRLSLPAQPRLSHPGWVLERVSWLQLAGAAVFLLGNALQCHSHWLLARLGRRGGSRAKQAYKIPRGGAFELVSCPHYLGEVVIYAGLALVAGGGRRATAWLMLLWVVTNLSLAAGMTHRWYREHFKSYPRRRRALFPFVF
ncbi:hypothetical protein ABPG75_013336 [Micractinium tetrahymenae]